MSKKARLANASLEDRIAKARREKRTQQALDLARQLYKLHRNDGNREILRQVTLERGLDLLKSRQNEDAATVFANALELSPTARFQATAIHGLISSGAVRQALTALEKIDDPLIQQELMKAMVDVAVSKGDAGKTLLPESMHLQFDYVQNAFQAYLKGQDEDVRAPLQNIGLQSPFLEWKVLLRGLIAYQTNDDTRAVENWQRLDPKRLPASLAAPMRAAIDPPYRNVQSPELRQYLRDHLMKIEGVAQAPALRELRELVHQENLGPAFRKVEAILPQLKADRPDLVKRLASVFYWAIINDGHPEDIPRFARVFGNPPDDPHLYRLQALATESRGLWAEAHELWQRFIKDVAESPKVWPGDVGKSVQALVWARMAENAGTNRSRRKRTGSPLFDLLVNEPVTLKPSEEKCLENAIKLAPDRIESQRDLFLLYREEHKLEKAKKLALQMLKRFPGDFETLDNLAGIYADLQEYESAIQYLTQAIETNPLHRELPSILAVVRQRWGLQLTLEADYAGARQQYEAALRTWMGPKTMLICQWAICELKAKNGDRAKELIAEALAGPNQRLAVHYALVGESIRAKLPPGEKKRIAGEFKDALADSRSPAEVVVLIQSAAQQHLVHDEKFHGQKSQEKSMVKFLDQIHFDAFDESQLSYLVKDLQTLEARKPWLNSLNYARRKYLKNPVFRLSFVEYYLTERSSDPKTHLAREHLDAARRLVNEMPRGDLQQRLLDEIQDKEDVIARLEARNRGMMDVLDQIFGGGGAFQEDDYDDDDYY